MTDTASCHLDNLYWFKTHLSPRLYTVVSDGFKSISQIHNKGVAQESILGPLCFTWYINVYLPIEHCNAHRYVAVMIPSRKIVAV